MSSNRAEAIARLPEMSQLPEEWTAKVDDDTRVYYIHGNYTTYDHPTFGVIPRPWQLRVDGTGPNAREYYYNKETKEKSKKDPRYGKKEMESRLLGIPRELRESATVTKNSKGLLQQMRRPPLNHNYIRDSYEIVHTIETPGPEAKGGMNGGIFVVRPKGGGRSKLYVEKRFSPATLQFDNEGHRGIGVSEILLTRKLIHPALTNAIDSFIYPDLENPRSGSLYLEFCDLGSLGDLIQKYASRVGTPEEAMVPERFMWHALVGLVDGLSYMYGGRSFGTDPEARSFNGRPVDGWAPVLHRDLKPDNILLRSRATLNSMKYPYLVISDFGLSTDNPDNYHQKNRICCGTLAFLAPELTYHPKVPPLWDGEKFPGTSRHSLKTDLWSLGACIYNLCRPSNAVVKGTLFRGPWNHLDLPSWNMFSDTEEWFMSRVSRKRDLDVGRTYSPQLRNAIRTATIWDGERRMTAAQLAPLLADSAKEAGFGDPHPSHSEALPDWSNKIHSYNSK